MGSAPLSVTHPELAAQWHPTRNGDLTPAGVTAGSGRMVWWQCPRGHEWDDSPGHRTGRGSGCAVCAGKRIQIGVNDLASTHPAIAEQWHHARNGNLLPTGVTAGSSKRFWWIDEFGHEWEAQVNNRANGTGCPYCASRLVLAGFNDLASNRPDIAAEWHPARNGDLRPDAIAPQSNRKVWFRCHDGHEWLSTVNNRTTLGQGCPVCAGQKVLPGFNDLATTNPVLAAQWHPTRNAPLTPHDVFHSTAKRFWWVDVLGHEWEASANERTNGSNCPYCCGQRVLVGFNDLATRMPELAAEWHPVKNGARTPQMVTVMNGTRAVPPGGILPRQPQHQVADLLADRRAARPSRVGPLAGNETAVPGQQRSRRDQTTAPQCGRQQPGQGRKDRAVGPSPAWAGPPDGEAPSPHVATP